MQALKDSSKRIVGTKQVIRALEEGALAKVFVAADADEQLLQTVKTACAKANVIAETVPTMNELGKACCIEVKAATAGVLK